MKQPKKKKTEKSEKLKHEREMKVEADKIRKKKEAIKRKEKREN